MEAIEALVQWSKPTNRMVAGGKRMVRYAEPTERFWEAWNEDKDALRAAGVRVYKDGERWKALWYQDDPYNTPPRADNYEAYWWHKTASRLFS